MNYYCWLNINLINIDKQYQLICTCMISKKLNIITFIPAFFIWFIKSTGFSDNTSNKQWWIQYLASLQSRFIHQYGFIIG